MAQYEAVLRILLEIHFADMMGVSVTLTEVERFMSLE